MCAVLHEIRSDYAQILTTIFLLFNGPGSWSLDAVLLRKRASAEHAYVTGSRSRVNLPATAAD
jgi:hypothetical protein